MSCFINANTHENNLYIESCRTHFEGIVDLEEAARKGTLRRGQLIFEEVTISHHKDATGATGWFYDTFASALMAIKLNQARDFAYFHVAVYAGQYRDTHFVIENGGFEPAQFHGGKTGRGTITACPMSDAFSKKSSFFVVSPPKDVNGDTTRYMIAQRALASVGVTYRYHMKAVSCETFALMMIGLFEDCQAYQQEILRSHKKDLSVKESVNQDERNFERYEEFYESIMRNIESVKPGVILTLDFLIKTCLRPSSGLTRKYHNHMPTNRNYIDK